MAEFQGIFCCPFLPSVLIIEGVGGMGGGVGWDGEGLVATRDEPILLFFSPIFLSSNSFILNLFFLIFCLKFMCFAQL